MIIGRSLFQRTTTSTTSNGNQSLLDVIKSGRLDERLVVLVLSVVPDCGLDIRSSSSSSSSFWCYLISNLLMNVVYQNMMNS